MGSVDVRHHLQALLVVFEAPGVPFENLARIQKPNRAVVVFGELAAHFEDFNVVHFLSEVTHFETLFDAVAVVVSGPDHRNFFTHGPEVVLNACVGSWLCGNGRHRGIKLDRDGSSSHSKAGLNASLHIAKPQRILHHLVLNIEPGVKLSVSEHF